MNNCLSFRRLLTIIILIGCAGCSTQKNTFVSRTYHNLLTHYNIYWNGNDAFKEGQTQLFLKLKDDYNQVLPVYMTGTQAEAQLIDGQMNRAIEKSNKAISKHSIIYNFKEYNRWIDDCYLLSGKASYMKQDYANAHRNFDFVMTNFKGEPSYYEAMLWQAKTCIQNEEYDRAGSLLAQLLNIASREKISGSIVREIPLVYAWLYQKEGNDGLTIKYLNEALKTKLQKNLKSRTLFILGQLYLKSADFTKSTQSFQKVLKCNPSFEMAFQAQINLAQAFDPSTGNTKSLEKSLQKMLREEKNKDYASQLYYALGSLALKDKNDTLAISRFKLSVATAGTNRTQKAYSALKLGELLFDRQQYIKSQVYYDTAVQFLSVDHPDFMKATQRAKMLTKLAKEIVIIDTEDSLQRIVRMPEVTRKEFISDLIEKVIKKEDQVREAEAKAKIIAPNIGFGNTRQNTSSMAGMTTGEWYFYNPSALSFGYSEFIKRWGRRTLEDNWRLSNKRMVTAFSNTLPKDTAKTSKLADASTDPHKTEYYLKNLPLTKEKLKTSDSLISNALFNVGLLYREGLSDNAKAAVALEQMLTRYPEQPHGAVPYFLLYRIFTDMMDSPKAEKYKALLIARYPDSEYAHIVTNPDYFKTVAKNRDKALKLYDETLDALKKGQLQLVSFYSKEALQNLSQEDPLRPRFEFTLALSLIKTSGRDSARVVLKNISTKYSTSPVSKQALAVLRSMDELPADLLLDNSYLEDNIYRYVPDQAHRYAILADSSKLNMIALQARISDIILKQFPSAGLTIHTGKIGNMSLFTISGFKNSEKALLFFDVANTETYIQSLLKELKNFQFIITEDNLNLIINNQKPDSYLKFFHVKYKR